jgi:hypothetical protein
MKRIFIGGTGRSGTTILHHALYRHHELFAIAVESKFLVEDGGLYDLVQGLTDHYSISHAQGAVRRFDDLMRFHFAERNRNSLGLELTLPDLFGATTYYSALDAFVDAITDGLFLQVEAAGRHSRNLYPSEVPAHINSIPKYYGDREALLVSCREFIGKLFDRKASDAGMNAWVEKTPTNLIRIDFLHELYPDSHFIHIKRDPRAVVYSLLRQGWAPDNIQDAANFMFGTYHYWLRKKKTLPSSIFSNYLEVKLEDLVQGPEAFLNALMNEYGFAAYTPDAIQHVRSAMQHYFEGGLDDPDKVDKKTNAWKYDLSRDEIDLLNRMYGEVIVAMGYEI